MTLMILIRFQKNKLAAIVIECGRYKYLSEDFKKINSLCKKRRYV